MVIFYSYVKLPEGIFGSQGYGIDAFREDEKKFLISAGAGAAKVRGVVVMRPSRSEEVY